MKKLVALMVALTMVLGLAAVASAADYPTKGLIAINPWSAGVGQRKSGLHTIPPFRPRRRRPGARFSLGQVLGSLGKHIKCFPARAESTKTLRPAFGGAACVNFGQPGFSLADAPTHNAWVGGLMCCSPDGYRVETKVDRRWRPSSRSWSETQ